MTEMLLSNWVTWVSVIPTRSLLCGLFLFPNLLTFIWTVLGFLSLGMCLPSCTNARVQFFYNQGRPHIRWDAWSNHDCSWWDFTPSCDFESLIKPFQSWKMLRLQQNWLKIKLYTRRSHADQIAEMVIDSPLESHFPSEESCFDVVQIKWICPQGFAKVKVLRPH